MNEPAKPVRIEAGLYKFYEKVAKEEGRSVTAQINYILRQRIPRELYKSHHKQEHENMTDEERVVYEARIEKSRQRGLAWKAKKDSI